MVKMALKVSYIGSDFSGSQIQKTERTVEGVLLDALIELGLTDSAESANIKSSGRTDAGVHALSQIITFDTNDPGLSIPRAINSKLPSDVWAWAYAIVPDDFNPRKDAVSRFYRYYLFNEKYDISKMRDAARLLVGTHDFSNFSKKDKKQERTTIRTIEKLDIRVSGELIQIDI